ncbi:hypothetical protein DICPUDRAFT_149165 [Dictyostelium purpureum]|uniref:Ankyrin repeat-containing protein n=1 Tax=Dictyostelium purpureum TaxID=5786 RepID=F0ZD05_DICPU|nr:uncharacterized protein DICPUDRAFT_149165 [Dictyostelium purpureum]EGC38183.1 hypothetical protein DICPUDRAFT_149165 [Dictyostelium purpureum]|eukprot:XP_003285310.1 hypothetical protein DICPUDRAFT_149165 [Dictyostelium purpureum]
MKIKEINEDVKEVKGINSISDENQLVYSSIFKHLNRGEMDQCIELIERDHSLVYSTEDHYGMTVLHLASSLKMRRLVKVILDIVSDDDLLSRNFDINKQDNNGNTSLHYACASSISEITSPNPSQQQQISPTPIVPEPSDINSFMYLKEKKSNRYSVVELLLERGASPTLANKTNMLPIHLACKEIDYKTVELLIENNDDQDIKISEPHAKVLDAFNFSLLFQSLQPSIYLTKHEKERNEKKKDIILSKIDPSLKCVKQGPTCLHYSLSSLKKIKDLTISLFINNNDSLASSTSSLSSSSSSSSHSSTSSPNTSKLHQQQSKDINIVERNHPLIKLIKLLLQKSCKPNHIDETTGKTAFQQFIHIFPSDENELNEFLNVPNADSENNFNEIFKEMIKVLIFSVTRLFHQYKYDFSLPSEKSIMESDKDIEETPLGQCSMYTSKLMVLEQLLNFFNQTKIQGNESSEENYQRVIDSLNNRNQPALFIACSYGNTKAVDLLLEAGSSPNMLDKFGCSMLHESLNFKHYDIAKKLILCGSDVNLPMSVYPQSTPLHIAASQACFDMCHFLVDHGSLLNVYDSEKQTPKDIIEKISQDLDGFFTSNSTNDLSEQEFKEQIQDLIDFFQYHVQINLVQISSFVVFKGDYKQKIHQFLKSKERNPNIVDKYMNEVFKESDKLDALIDSSNIVQIPLKEVKTMTKRIKIKTNQDSLFKYVNLYNQTYHHLLNVIRNRFKPINNNIIATSIESVEQFEKNHIKSIILLPNVLISDDKDIEFIKDDDEIQVEFK